MTIVDQLNRYLKSIFNVDDAVYKSVIADKDGVPAGTITKPTDFNSGQIANVLEYLRGLSKDLLTQIFLNQAEGKYLDLIAQDTIGLTRYSGENDADFVARIQKFLIGDKISKAAIIFCTRPFSSPGEPVILEGEQDAAYATFSFAGVYSSFQLVAPPSQFNFFVFPAISRSQQSAFFFVIQLENTPSEDIFKVIDILNRTVAAGIVYELQILTV